MSEGEGLDGKMVSLILSRGLALPVGGSAVRSVWHGRDYGQCSSMLPDQLYGNAIPADDVKRFSTACRQIATPCEEAVVPLMH